MIDWDRISELRAEIGPDDFREVVALFLQEVDEEIAVLRAAPPEDELEARLHYLKGSALNLGFADFSRLCQDGERAAAQGLHARIDLGAILECFDASKAAFLERMEARPPP